MKNDITKTINNIFPNLNQDDKNLLISLTNQITDTIQCFIFWKDGEIMQSQMMENDYQDIKAIINMILPFIENKDNYIKYSDITSFNDIYKRKIDPYSSDKSKNNYHYCNIQYNRAFRGVDFANKVEQILDDNKDQKDRLREINRIEGNPDDIFEIGFTPEHLLDNTKLIKEAIRNISNKLYINWINIQPISLLKYQKTKLYQDTIEWYNKQQLYWYNPFIGEEKSEYGSRNSLEYCGLGIPDIYNAITNYFYYQIKKIKWLLYEIKIDDKPIPFVKILEDFLMVDDKSGLNFLINRKVWIDIDEYYQNRLESNWKNILIYANNGENYNGYSGQALRSIIKYLFAFFQSNYIYLPELKKNGQFIPINLEIDVNEEDSDEETVSLKSPLELDISEVVKSLLLVPFEDIYLYLQESLISLHHSWYWNLVQENGKIKSTSIIITEKNRHITWKNLYNYGKLFSHKVERGEFIFMGNLWHSLSMDEREMVMDRINKNNNNWFKINGYLRRLYKYSSRVDIQNHSGIIFNYIQNNLIKLVFESLIKKGLLSEFIRNPTITDSKLIPQEYNANNAHRIKEMEKMFEDKKDDLGECYYYASNTKYKDLPKLRSDDGKYQDIDYFTFTAKHGRWFTFYAMNWMCQIDFYSHYINNRVLYVTGSTGQGKSTQVPKLLLYALKMIDYRQIGRIVCTQPRISPTENVSRNIANEMGLPIKQPSKTLPVEANTGNTTIQYKHSKDSHVNQLDPFYLLMMTDGTLLEQIVTNPLMKVKRTLKNRKDNSYLQNFQYTTQNMYDIIIVDEAHEHNTNMDFILTMARSVCYYNNNMRLIIISATIDDDEPIYRRYYRDINDNRLYPFNQAIVHYEVDRVNMDRRFHISPPGQTTQHKVTDIYDSSSQDTYVENEKRAIEKAIEISVSGDKGDILFFTTGVAEIIKICKALNERTPPNTIALPFHGKIESYWAKVIENSKFSDIVDDRSTIIDLVNGNANSSSFKRKPVGKGTYTRAIVVATNVAEASITITTLKYVIETGFAKVNKFNPYSQTSELKLEKISESSRVQRRGRVGRVASGTVYYTYPEDARKNILPEYKLCNEDIHSNLFKLLRFNYEEKALITNLEKKPLSIYWKTDRNNKDASGAWKILENQNYKNGKYIPYFGNLRHYDYFGFNYTPEVNHLFRFTYYQTGFDMNTVYDNEGIFYLIHPDEPNVQRDILTGRILSYQNDKTKNIIVPKKIDKFKLMMIKEMMIVDFSDNVKVIEGLKKDDILVNKTFFGNQISLLNSQLLMAHSDLTTLAYSGKYECRQEIITLMAMLQSAEKMSSWIFTYQIDGKYRMALEEFKSLYGNVESDLQALYTIWSNFLTAFPKLELDRIDLYTPDMMYRKFEDDKNIYHFIRQQIVDGVYSEYDIPNEKYLLYKSFNDLLRQNKMDDDNQYVKYFKQNLTEVNKIKEKIEELKPSIMTWCDSMYLNSNTFFSFLDNYLMLRHTIMIDETLFEWPDDNLVIISQPKNKIHAIIKSFLHGNFEKIVLYHGKEEMENFNYNKNNTDANRYIENMKIIRSMPFRETTLTHRQRYIMYLKKRPFNDVIYSAYLSNISPEWIMEVGFHIYNHLNAPKYSEFMSRYFHPSNYLALTKIDDPELRKFLNYLMQSIQNKLIPVYGLLGGKKPSNKVSTKKIRKRYKISLQK